MANPPTLHAVIFRIGALNCAVPAGIVREILPPLPATRVPGVADSVRGLVNVRGSLLTVVDGLRLIGQEPRAADEGAIVVVEVGGRRYGLGVSQVNDFVEVPEQAIVARADLPGVDPRLVRAVGLFDEQPFVVLDLDALFGPVMGGDGSAPR